MRVHRLPDKTGAGNPAGMAAMQAGSGGFRPVQT